MASKAKQHGRKIVVVVKIRYDNNSTQILFPLIAIVIIYTQDQPITQQVRGDIVVLWSTQDLHKHLENKFGWNTDEANSIGWEVYGIAYNK